MKQPWPLVSLGDVLRQDKSYLAEPEDRPYKKMSVKLYGKGVVLDSSVDGAALKMRKHQLAKTDQVVVSEIWAKKGAIGIVPEECSGALCTSHFYLFDHDPEKISIHWLSYLLSSNLFEKQLDEQARGTTGYAAIRPSQFLSCEVPLPPLGDQQRIVSRIDTVRKHLKAADKLRKSTTGELHALCRSLVVNDPSTKLMTVAEFVNQRPTDVIVEPDVSYQFAGVYSFGRGVFKGGIKAGAEFAYPKLSRIKTGDFTYPKLMAWEGALGVVPDECDGCVVSPEFPVFEIDQSKVLPDVFDVYFRDPSTWESLQGGSTGTNARRRRLNPSDFLKLKIPVPNMATQRKLATIRLHQKKLISLSTDAESSAVLASLLNTMLIKQ
jgi:type I restriction enzyme, S subunit